MGTKIEFAGKVKSIELLLDDDGECPTGEFLAGLSASDRAKVDVLFERMGDHGKITNNEKFKKLEGSDGIWEFKSFQIRLLCFNAPGGRLVICKAVIKKSDRHEKETIRSAEASRKKFLES